MTVFFFWVSSKGREGSDGRLGDGINDVWNNNWSDSKMSLNYPVKLSHRYLHCRAVLGWQPWFSGQQKWADSNQDFSPKEPKTSQGEGRRTQKSRTLLLVQNQTSFLHLSDVSDPTLSSELQELHNLISRQFSHHLTSERNSNKYKITPSNIQRKTFYFKLS